MSRTIRCVKNCILTLTRDGETYEEHFPFGRWYKVQCVEIIDQEYMNVIFEDGSAAAGLQRNIFEVGRTVPVTLAMERFPEEPQDAPEQETQVELSRPLRLPIDIIGNKEPARG
jgi:hypothetical protein